MSNPSLHGFPQSSYVWSARSAFAVAGVDVDFEPMTPGDHKKPEHLARHPMGKVPTMTHGDLTLFECISIMRYADGLAGNNALFPADAKQAAQVMQWLSTVNCYLYKAVVVDWFFGAQRDATEEQLADASNRAETILGKLEASIGSGPWIVGDSVTAADLLVGPHLFLLTRVPGGPELLAKFPKVQRLQGALAETPGFIGNAPPGLSPDHDKACKLGDKNPKRCEFYLAEDKKARKKGKK